MFYDQTIENQIAADEQPEHVIPGGFINETPGNLFDYEKDYALAHWISADSGFDTGLSQYFQARYSTRDELRQRFPQEWNGKGYCLATNDNHVFNLVIKHHQYETPQLRNVESALAHMKEIAEEHNVYKIALPRITVPSDVKGFTWLEAKDKLMNLFMGTNFDIRVVYLDEYIKGEILDPDMERLNFGKDRHHIDGNVEKKYY